MLLCVNGFKLSPEITHSQPGKFHLNIFYSYMYNRQTSDKFGNVSFFQSVFILSSMYTIFMWCVCVVWYMLMQVFTDQMPSTFTFCLFPWDTKLGGCWIFFTFLRLFIYILFIDSMKNYHLSTDLIFILIVFIHCWVPLIFFMFCVFDYRFFCCCCFKK